MGWGKRDRRDLGTGGGGKWLSFFLSFSFPPFPRRVGLSSVLLGPRDPGPLGILKSCHYPKGMRIRSHRWERRKGGQRGGRKRERERGYWEGKGHRPKFLGSCSFSHSEKQRNRESDLESDTNRARIMEMAERWERPEKTLKERERGSNRQRALLAPAAILMLSFCRCLSPLRSPQLCPSSLSSPTARHLCLSLHLSFAPGPRSGVNRLLGLKAEQWGEEWRRPSAQRTERVSPPHSHCQ